MTAEQRALTWHRDGDGYRTCVAGCAEAHDHFVVRWAPLKASTDRPERMPDAEFEMRVRTEGTWTAVADGERAETALAIEARRARSEEDCCRAEIDALRAELAAAAKRLEKAEADALAALPKTIREALSQAERALLLNGAESEEDGSPGRQALASIQEARRLVDARNSGGRT